MKNHPGNLNDKAYSLHATVIFLIQCVEMKKILVLVLAVMMLGTACCAPAEEARSAPLYKTIGDALDAARAAAGEEGNVVSGSMIGEYAAVITDENGKYFRHIADYDEKLAELRAALDGLDFEAEDYWEKWEAAMAEADAYERTLPIAYSEAFTAEPIAQADLDALDGKTVAELTEAGYEMEMSGTGGEEITYTMRNGIFIYDFTADADEETYFAAMENGTEGDLVLKNGKFAGISYNAWDKRYHADGTVEEEQPIDFTSEMPPEAAAMMDMITEIVNAARNGEEIDIDKMFDTIEEQFPDKKEEIEVSREMIKQMIETYGVESLAQMIAPVE